MEVNRLKSDELTWELMIRGCDIGTTVEQKRSQLRDALSRNLAVNPNVQLDPFIELNICSVKLDELIGYIQEFDIKNRQNEFKRINSRLLHIQGRLNQINVTTDEAERKRTNLIFILSNAIEALKDADHIASFDNISSKRVVSNNQIQLSSSQENCTSILDMPNVMSQSSEPRLAQLIDVEMGPTNNSHVNSETVEQHPVLRNDHALSQSDEMMNTACSINQQICTRLLEKLNQLTLQPVTRQWFHTHPIRHVNFASTSNSTQVNPLIETVPSVSTCDANFRVLNSTSHQEFPSAFCSGVVNPANVVNNNLYQKSIPVYKWNISFDGSGSVTSFIEEVEQLAESRHVSRMQLFQSAYELLRGDARDWYLPRKSNFETWEDFKRGLRDDFLPLNYEENLLEEIKRRTQGLDERFMLYITRMQNLFKKLTVKKPTEKEQIEIIRKRMLPHFQTALTFEETLTIEDLLTKGKRAEQNYLEAQQYCPPPTSSRFIQEPHLTYRRPNYHQRPLPVRAIQNAEVDTDLNQTSTNSSSGQVDPRVPHAVRNKDIICWNCNQSGHRRTQCTQPLKLYCFKCGQVGYTTRTCNCSKNSNQGN